ncbi:hypothetical protein Hanom_Chr15g01347311 [Helianthus anomalus]
MTHNLFRSAVSTTYKHVFFPSQNRDDETYFDLGFGLGIWGFWIRLVRIVVKMERERERDAASLRSGE